MKIKYSFVPVVALSDCVQSQERSQDFSFGGGGGTN